MTQPSWLAAAARKSVEHEGTLGFIFERYRRLKNKTSEDLANELGCSLETLAWLSLCRMPEESRFAEDLDIIATRFNVETHRLAPMLRLAKVLHVFSAPKDTRETSDAPSIELLAARDRAPGKKGS